VAPKIKSENQKGVGVGLDLVEMRTEEVVAVDFSFLRLTFSV
jgi:hypothetical protein